MYNRNICRAVFVFAVVFLLAACSALNDSLEVPVYPLTSQTLSEVLESSGMNYRVSDVSEGVHTSRQSGFGVYDGEGEENLVFSVGSGTDGTLRAISISFHHINYELIHDAYIYTVEDCNEIFSLASILMGGFLDADSVYEAFVKDYEKGKNMLMEDSGTPGSITVTWKRDLDDIACKVVFMQYNGSETMYVKNITFESK